MPSTSLAVYLTEKHCKSCGVKLVITKQRDVERKQYCSFNCKSEFQKTISTAERFLNFTEARKCEGCSINFIATQKTQRFCTKNCQARIGSRRSLAKHNTLEDHLKRLLKRNDRKHLSINFLKNVYEAQNGLCALTSVPMTWETLNGRVATNISMDRVDSSIGYEEQNIQLVCRIVNIMKHDLSVNEFVGWCKLVEQNNAF